MRPFFRRKTFMAFILAVLMAGAVFFPAPSHAAGQLASGVYTVNRTSGLLSGVKANTSAAAMIANMSNSADSLSVTDRNGSAYTGGTVATGMTLRLSEGGSISDTLTIVVNGDTDGDGRVSVSDYTLVRLYLLGKKTLDKANFSAGDVSGNGTLSVRDYTQLRLNILGLSELGHDALPLAGCVIGIDPGHQRHANNELEPLAPGSSVTNAKVSGGTTGRWTGVPEYVVNLQVGLKLKAELEELGATVVITRTSHDVNISNAERAQMMNNAHVNCWLRIHSDGSSNASDHGVSILVPSPGTMNTSDANVQTESARLAGLLLDNVIETTGAYSRGLKLRSDQTGFCWSSLPVCNIEMGYMTNEAEDKLLVTDDYQNKIVDGLVQGFLKYF